jgi:hypothetical protein
MKDRESISEAGQRIMQNIRENKKLQRIMEASELKPVPNVVIMQGDMVLCDGQWYEVIAQPSYLCRTKDGEERELDRDQIELVDPGPGPR